MSIRNDGNRQVQPCHPGEMLREDFLPEYGLSAKELAGKLKVSDQTVGEILCEHSSVTPLMALRLSRVFGNSAGFWLNAQHRYDLWKTQEEYRDELEQIQLITA